MAIGTKLLDEKSLVAIKTFVESYVSATSTNTIYNNLIKARPNSNIQIGNNVNGTTNSYLAVNNNGKIVAHPSSTFDIEAATNISSILSVQEIHVATGNDLTSSGRISTDTSTGAQLQLSATGSIRLNAPDILSYNFYPVATASGTSGYDLGETSLKWRNLYLAGKLTDGSNEITIANIGTVKSVGATANSGIAIAGPSTNPTVGIASTHHLPTAAEWSALGSAYRFQGTKTVAELNNDLGTVTSAMNGYVYNVSNSGTLTKGSVVVNAGDNVAIVWSNNDNDYTWDRLAGTMDLSNYVDLTTDNQVITGLKYFNNTAGEGGESEIRIGSSSDYAAIAYDSAEGEVVISDEINLRTSGVITSALYDVQTISSTSTGGITITASHVKPGSASAYDLGLSTWKWRNLYLSNTMYSEYIGSGNVTVSTSNVIAIAGRGVLTQQEAEDILNGVVS